MSVRTSTKSFFNFNDIWYVGRGRWVMHDGMQYDPIQGQGHEHSNVGNSAIFKGYLLSFIMGAGKWPRILKLGHNTYSLLGPDFLILSQFLCHVTLKLAVSRSRPSWYGATLFKFLNTVSSRCHFYVTSYYTNVPMLRFTTQEMVNFFVCLSVCWLLCWTVWCSLPQLFCNCQTISK